MGEWLAPWGCREGWQEEVGNELVFWEKGVGECGFSEWFPAGAHPDASDFPPDSGMERVGSLPSFAVGYQWAEFLVPP